MHAQHPPQESRTVESWFYAWLERHMQRCRSQGWPTLVDGAPDDHASHFYLSWIKAFRERGLTEEVADEASALLALGPYSWPSTKHLNELLAHVQAAWDRVHARQRGVNPGTREEAELASRGCPECNGDGRTVRRARRDGEVRVYSMFCLCPYGEFLAQYYFNQSDKEIYRRMRRLIQYPELWEPGLAHRSWPASPDARPWPVESCWLPPEGAPTPYPAGFDRGKAGGAVKTAQEGIAGPAF